MSPKTCKHDSGQEGRSHERRVVFANVRFENLNNASSLSHTSAVRLKNDRLPQCVVRYAGNVRTSELKCQEYRETDWWTIHNFGVFADAAVVVVGAVVAFAIVVFIAGAIAVAAAAIVFVTVVVVVTGSDSAVVVLIDFLVVFAVVVLVAVAASAAVVIVVVNTHLILHRPCLQRTRKVGRTSPA